MKLRSLTLFADPQNPIQEGFLSQAEGFANYVNEIIKPSQYELQTLRFATPPFPLILQNATTSQLITYAKELENHLISFGYDYLSLGPALPSHPKSYMLVPDLVENTNNVFCSGLMTDTNKTISMSSVKACGKIIQQLSSVEPDGFSNLFFAALGNVPAGAPFFPAAYHHGKHPNFSIAVEAADLAVMASSQGSSFRETRELLISEIEKHAQQISTLSQDLEKASRIKFFGIDFSLAPFPKKESSIGTAFETLGIDQIGKHGSLAAAAFLADTIDQADFPRAGFNGLFLPLLEDAILAKRAEDGTIGIKDLLLYSAVCGTGLDTLPIPGDTSAEQISAILYDLATLSTRLNKPLTARLMPIPGKKAGDPTSFDFPYFQNTHVLEVQAEGLKNLFLEDDSLEIHPHRNHYD